MASDTTSDTPVMMPSAESDAKTHPSARVDEAGVLEHKDSPPPASEQMIEESLAEQKVEEPVPEKKTEASDEPGVFEGRAAPRRRNTTVGLPTFPCFNLGHPCA